jgi:hypothetical protein
MIELLGEMLALLRSQDRDEKQDQAAPLHPEPEPRKLRQNEQAGVDMNSMLRRADAERRSRRLPRSPEEARGERRYWR